MNEQELRFSLKAPLNDGDTESQTYGCRATNPDICKKYYVEGTCAFTSPGLYAKHHQQNGKIIIKRLWREIND